MHSLYNRIGGNPWWPVDLCWQHADQSHAPSFPGPFTALRSSNAERDKASGVSCSVALQTKQHGEKSAYLLTSDMSVATGSGEESGWDEMLHSVGRGMCFSCNLKPYCIQVFRDERFKTLHFTSQAVKHFQNVHYRNRKENSCLQPCAFLRLLGFEKVWTQSF